MAPQQPQIVILKDGTDRKQARNAQGNNIAAAKAVADTVRTTLGPRGMDKMLVDTLGDVIITNDGATILQEVEVEHPAAKMIVEVAKTQDKECGDGTTTAVVLTGELLSKAEALLGDIHPTIICQGYHLALAESIKHLGEWVEPGSEVVDDAMLMEIAKTSMNSKSARAHADHLGQIAINAVEIVTESRKVKLDNIVVQKEPGGSIEDTRLISGMILDRECKREPKTALNSPVLLLDLDLKPRKVHDVQMQMRNAVEMQRALDAEDREVSELITRIKDSGAGVVMTIRGINDLAAHLLSKHGIMAVENVRHTDMAKLASVTGAKVINNATAIDKDALGYVENCAEKDFGTRKLIIVEHEASTVASILVRGGTEHVIDEIHRGMWDAISAVKDVVEDEAVVPGGGAMEMVLGMHLRKYAQTLQGRLRMAVTAYADALEIIPRTLAENAGMDGLDAMITLRQFHENGHTSSGIDVLQLGGTGNVADMHTAKVLEPLRILTQALKAATEAAVMILRIDDVIAARRAPSEMPPEAK